MADAKEQDSSEESEIDTNRENQMQQKQQMKMNQIPEANSASKLQSVTVLTGSNSGEGLSGGSTGGKNSTENLNDLPEDKEIQSSSEDEL